VTEGVTRQPENGRDVTDDPEFPDASNICSDRVAGVYAELHCHTNFSFLDGASFPEELVERAVELGYGALAVTDHDGFYGVSRFWQAARQSGLAAVYGVEVGMPPRGPNPTTRWRWRRPATGNGKLPLLPGPGGAGVWACTGPSL
jgi:alkylation response protein AidB-like acyl-CoA dehydrogenase